MTPGLNYIFFHLSGIAERAMNENNEKDLNTIASEIRSIQERIDTYYCLQQDNETLPNDDKVYLNEDGSIDTGIIILQPWDIKSEDNI